MSLRLYGTLLELMNFRGRRFPVGSPFYLAGIALITASAVQASDVWTLPLFSPDPARVYDEALKFKAPPDADVYAIDLNMQIRLDAEGKAVRTRRGVWRVLTDAGAKKLANWTESWPAWREKKPTLQLRIITSDKKAHLLDPATVTVAGLPGSNDVYSDIQVLQAPLPAISANSVMEFEVVSGDRESVIPGQRFDRLEIANIGYLHHFVVDLQASRKLSAIARGFEKIDRKDTSDHETQSIRFEAWEIKPIERKPLLPPDLPPTPVITFSTVSSWQEVARWYHQVTEPLLGAEPPMDQSEGPDRATKIAGILADIQKNVRYTGLELGLSGFVPHSPEETLKRGYGDCKDKAALLISRLRKEGIPAELALLRPYPFPEIEADLPGMEAFNHAIVYVPGKQPLWIDPTSQYSPASRLPFVDQGRNVLIVDPASTALVRTPESTAQDNGAAEEVTVTLQPQGKSDISSVETFFGSMDEISRTLFASIFSSQESRTNLETQLKKRQRVDSLAILDSTPATNLSQPYQFKQSGRGWELGITQSETANVYLPVHGEIFGMLLQFPAPDSDNGKADKRATRTEDYYLPVPFEGEVRYVVLPPAGFRVKHQPELAKLDLGPVKVSSSTSVRADNAVIVEYKLSSERRRYTVAEVAQIVAGMKKLQAMPSVHLEFVDQIHELLASGKEREALKLARERVAADPKSVGALIRLAATLSSVGANLKAIETCREATKVDPKSAVAAAELADLYTRDETGRAFHLGMRYFDAVEALQHAIELDPDDAKLKLKLANVYEYDAMGARLGKTAHLADAIALLRKIEKDLPKLKASGALPEALLFNRQYSDVKKFYEDDTNEAPLSYRFAAVAVTDGVEGVQKVFDAAGAEASRQAQFTSAAQHLILLHEYSPAAILLGEAMQVENESSRAEISMLRKTRRREDAVFSKEPPIALVQHLIYALLDPDDEESWKKLFVPEYRDFAVRTERNELLGRLAPWRALARNGVGWATTADLAVSNADLISEGSDEVGYRVRIPDASNNGDLKTIAWVVKRPDGYQLLGLGPTRTSTGEEALHAAQKGDLKSARQWLDWLREEQTVPKGADPLAGWAFLKLWPVPKAGAAEMINAAASLVVRGGHFAQSLEPLLDAEKNSEPGAYRDAIDLAIVHGYFLHQQWANALSEAKQLHDDFPESEVGLDTLLTALLNTGDLSGARKLVEEGLSRDPKSAAYLRAQYRLSSEQEDYERALDAMRKVTHTAKVSASDWNNLAWVSLFVNDTGVAALEAASKANRLTQNRSGPDQHTLGCLKALQGDTAGARKALFQYVDLGGARPLDDSARMLLGLIDEQLDLMDVARENFEKLTRPKPSVGGSSYALAQKRLAAMKSATR